MIDFREEREKELQKFYEMEPKHSGKLPKPGQKFTSIEQLPEWVQKKMPELAKWIIEKGVIHKPMQPGTTVARIVIKDPAKRTRP